MAEIDGSEVTLLVTGSEWRSGWAGWDEAEALHAICLQLAKPVRCGDTGAARQRDHLELGSARARPTGGRQLFSDLPVKDVN